MAVNLLVPEASALKPIAGDRRGHGETHRRKTKPKDQLMV